VVGGGEKNARKREGKGEGKGAW